jgi:outer membrane protein assembly factor BamB
VCNIRKRIVDTDIAFIHEMMFSQTQVSKERCQMNIKAWQSKESSRGWPIRDRMVRWGIVIGLGIASGAFLFGADDGSKDWPMFGGSVSNDASGRSEGITAGNVSKLHTKWTFATGGDVTARAAVVDGVAYFPDWGGNIWAVDANTGAKIWGHQLSEYGLTPGTLSRTSPAVVNGMV